MSILLGDLRIDASALETVLGTVAQRANMCVKVLDQYGVVRAVNERGLAILQVCQEDFCGQVWTSLWDGESQQRAISAVNQGFDGIANSFSGTFQTGDGVMRSWVVEVVPLNSQENVVDSLLVISNDVTAHPYPVGAQPETIEAMQSLLAANKDSLHNLNNIVSMTAGASRILSREPDAEKVAQLSQYLHECSLKCHDAIARLQSAVEAVEEAQKDALA
jgi:hypothetical protein